ncbi:MAG TPA: DUF6600 domain-containing protein [Polyangiaceae bacterium]|nr:DUF6600 domain-containing protein [Polyangiaceae bacterium]
MSTHIARYAVVAIAALGALTVGCAEDEAEGREVAYPVGVSAPPAQEQPAMTQPPVPPPPAAPAYAEPAPAAEPAAPEVVVGEDVEEQDPQEQVSSDAQALQQEQAVDDADPSALTAFRTTLDPYGTWVEDPTYGSVWVPSEAAVGPDFAPYVTAGHWAYGDDYVWVSDYAWGWAPFHYGRWAYVGGVGWEWIPGRVYAGAWVSWRYGWDDWAYVGWAPLAPTWCWRRGVAVGIGFAPAPYAFVPSGDLFARSVGAHVIVGARAATIGAHTRAWAPPATATGRVIARPGVVAAGGPPPSMLRIPQSAVVRASVSARVPPAAGGFAARGAVAQAAARASVPGGGAVRASAGVAPGRVVAPAYGPAAPSHFGGRLGSGFIGNPALTAPSSPYAARPYFGPAPRGSARAFSEPAPAPAPAYRGGYGGGRSAAPAAVAPAAAPAAAPASAPAVASRSGGFGGVSTGGFHGGGGYSSGFHGGGGGSRGGGRGGGRR